MYDLVIIGGGPAGIAAAIYAVRKKLKTALLTIEFGGQSSLSPSIENWLGEISISGMDLAKKLEAHVRHYEKDIDIKTGDEGKVKSITVQEDKTFNISTETGETYSTRAILIASGSSRRKLKIPGAEEFEGRGIVYCASCDGPLFAGLDVAVVGGGNAGFETALQLSAYCPNVYLLNRSDKFKADEITVRAAEAKDNIHILKNTEPVEIQGDNSVNLVKIKNNITGEISDLNVRGVFVEIGQVPNNYFLPEELPLDDYGKIKIRDWRTQQTFLDGIWAAGDITDGYYHQNNIAAGDAVKALENIYIELNKNNE